MNNQDFKSLNKDQLGPITCADFRQRSEICDWVMETDLHIHEDRLAIFDDMTFSN